MTICMLLHMMGDIQCNYYRFTLGGMMFDKYGTEDGYKKFIVIWPFDMDRLCNRSNRCNSYQNGRGLNKRSSIFGDLRSAGW